MLKLTSWIALKIQNLPDWDVDWTDDWPWKSQSSLTCADFLPDEADATDVHKRAIVLVMEILVAEFTLLGDIGC